MLTQASPVESGIAVYAEQPVDDLDEGRVQTLAGDGHEVFIHPAHASSHATIGQE